MEDYTSSVEKFIDRCQQAGKKVFDLELDIPMRITYVKDSIPNYYLESGIEMPIEYTEKTLSPGKKFILASTVSHSLMSIKSREHMTEINNHFGKLNFSDKEWSNYLVNKGIEESTDQSGAERMLFLMGELSALNNHRKLQKETPPHKWIKYYSKNQESLSRIKSLSKSSSTNDIIKTCVELEIQPDIALKHGIKTEDLEKIKKCMVLVKLPYVHNAKPMIEILEKDEFQTFVKKWEPRNLNEEILGIDPIPYFLGEKFRFDIPCEHKKVIKNEVTSVIS
jgi:hypothetical protein